MRKWVAEIREPNKCSRIWLGFYSTPVAVARAYDTIVFYLRGPLARLNFLELLGNEGGGCSCRDLLVTFIRKKAIEIGARFDAHEMALRHHHHHTSAVEAAKVKPISRFVKRVDLKKHLDLENSDGECDWERN
ncbi:hypothetical protein UlMin_023975 [Ulmus minor]